MATGTVKSVVSMSELTTLLSDKADILTNGVTDNFFAIDSSGNLKDSGHKHDDYVHTASQSLTSAQQSQVRTNIGLGGASTQSVANNLTTTSAGSVLDARQGKALKDLINGRAQLIGFGTLGANTSKKFRSSSSTVHFLIIAMTSSTARCYLGLGRVGSSNAGVVVDVYKGASMTTATGNYYITLKNSDTSYTTSVYAIILDGTASDLTFNT